MSDDTWIQFLHPEDDKGSQLQSSSSQDEIEYQAHRERGGHITTQTREGYYKLNYDRLIIQGASHAQAHRIASGMARDWKGGR